MRLIVGRNLVHTNVFANLSHQMKTSMETYHKVICPQCKQMFTPTQSIANLLGANHIVCPHCDYKMTPMEVKKTQRKTTWDLVRELFNI